MRNSEPFTGKKLPESKYARSAAFIATTGKPAKYVFSLENIRQSKKNITKLTDDKGNVYTSKNQNLNHITEFYTNLNTEDPTDANAQQTRFDSIHQRLPTDVSEMLEGELDLEECCAALSNMRSQESPETDGLPAEFHTMFWDVFGCDLIDVIDYNSHHNVLAKSMRSAILILPLKVKTAPTKITRFTSKIGGLSPC